MVIGTRRDTQRHDAHDPRRVAAHDASRRRRDCEQRVGCRVARVEPASVALPGAYGYYDVEGKWSDRAERAVWVFTGASNLSGFYSPALERYVLLYSEYLGNRVYAVTAPDLWGPFSEPRELMTALAPQQFWIDRVDVHPGYASADGKRFVFGYHTDNPEAPGLHFVEVTIR